MRKILLLVKIFLKGGGGLTSGSNKKAKWIVPIILLFAFGTFAFSMVIFADAIYGMLAPVGMQDIILPLIFGASCVVTFLFGIFYVISVMYHAEDIEQLRYLPLTTSHILGSKFITLVIYEYIFEAFILGPVLIAFGLKSGAGAIYYIYSILLFLITPIIALSMAALLVMIVMRFTSFGKNKQAFKFVGGILAMVLALGFNLLMQGSVSNLTDEQFFAAFQNSTLPQLFSNLFPGIGFASQALINSNTLAGLWNLLLFALCSAAAVAVFMGAGHLLYLKGIAGVTETSAKRKAIQNLAKETEGTSAVAAYVKKEFRLLTRSPIAFLNCVLITLIWPLLIVIIFFSGGGGGKFNEISAMLAQANEGLVIAILTGTSAFVASSNAVTSTAISREGQSLYFMKYIPMSMRKQLQAKTIIGMILSGISVILLMAVAVLMGVNIVTALISLALSLIVMAATSYAGLLIDVANPKLQWINEQQAIKQNLNVILHMLVGVVFGAIAIVPAAMLGTSLIVSTLYCLVFFLVVLLILRNRVNNRAAEKLIGMDV